MKSLFTFLALFLAIAHGLLLHQSNSHAGAPPSPRPEQLELLLYSAEGPSHFLLVEKKHQKLKLFEQGTALRLIKEYTCATGENFGNKRASGDSRTPEGIYFITEIYEDKKVTVFGSRAFHLDYPNVFDSHAGHLGDGIFIHGTNKKLVPNSTNGCITLDNGDLEELAPYLAVGTLPVIILAADSDATLSDSLLLEKGSAQMNDILAKISVDTTTIPLDSIRTLSSLQVGSQAIISMTYKVFEDQSTQYQERRRAYLAQAANDKWRTLQAVHSQDPAPTLLAQHPLKNDKVVKIADIGINAAMVAAQSSPAPVEASPEAKEPREMPKVPLTITAKSKIVVRAPVEIQAAKPARPPAAKPATDAKTEELLAFLEKWRSSWATKDLDTYMNCYSSTFRGGDLNKDQWREKKAFLNNKYKFITVKLSNIQVSLASSTAKVTFHQTYRSDQLQVSGVKTMQLVNRKNRWFIESEMM